MADLKYELDLLKQNPSIENVREIYADFCTEAAEYDIDFVMLEEVNAETVHEFGLDIIKRVVLQIINTIKRIFGMSDGGGGGSSSYSGNPIAVKAQEEWDDAVNKMSDKHFEKNPITIIDGEEILISKYTEVTSNMDELRSTISSTYTDIVSRMSPILLYKITNGNNDLKFTDYTEAINNLLEEYIPIPDLNVSSASVSLIRYCVKNKIKLQVGNWKDVYDIVSYTNNISSVNILYISTDGGLKHDRLTGYSGDNMPQMTPILLKRILKQIDEYPISGGSMAEVSGERILKRILEFNTGDITQETSDVKLEALKMFQEMSKFIKSGKTTDKEQNKVRNMLKHTLFRIITLSLKEEEISFEILIKN